MPKAWDIRAWTYEADIHCVKCAETRFTAEGLEAKSGAVDSEGNPPHPVFQSDEASPAGEYCGTCLEEISEPYGDRQPY